MTPVEQNLLACCEEQLADMKFVRDCVPELAAFCTNSIEVGEHYLALAKSHEHNRRVMAELGVQ